MIEAPARELRAALVEHERRAVRLERLVVGLVALLAALGLAVVGLAADASAAPTPDPPTPLVYRIPELRAALPLWAELALDDDPADGWSVEARGTRCASRRACDVDLELVGPDYDVPAVARLRVCRTSRTIATNVVYPAAGRMHARVVVKRDGPRLGGIVCRFKLAALPAHGIASWYGPPGPTEAVACGSGIIPAGAHGFAHRTLPCGTLVEACAGAACVRERVVDRGPYVPGRELDALSATFAALAPLSAGLVAVEWSVVKAAPCVPAWVRPYRGPGYAPACPEGALLAEPECVCWHDADVDSLDDEDREAVEATGAPVWRVLDARLHPSRVGRWYAAETAYRARLEDRVAELELAAAAARRRTSSTGHRVARAMLGPWGVA